MDAPEFGVHTSNAFLLLDEDAPVPPKKKPEAPKPVVAVKKTETRAPRDDTRGKGGKGGRGEGGKGRGRGGGKGGRGGGKGGKGGDRDRAPREGKREFDRHESGTGRRDRTKKDGAGKYNWGTDQDNYEGGKDGGDGRPPRRNNRYNNDGEDRPRRNNRFSSNEAKTPADGETAAEAAPADADASEAKNESEEVNKEVKDDTPPEPDVIGYDEYLAQVEANRVKDDVIQRTREVENDDKQWKNFAVREEEEEVNEYAYKTDETSKKKKKAAGKKKADKLSLDEFVKGPSSGGRGGGKGGKGRGGKGKGGGRGGQRAPPMNEDQFPTLGKK